MEPERAEKRGLDRIKTLRNREELSRMLTRSRGSLVPIVRRARADDRSPMTPEMRSQPAIAREKAARTR